MSRFSFAFLFTVALLLNLTACNKSDTQKSATASDELVVRIGAAAPLTGPQAHIGKDNENGTRMAIEDANAKGIMIGGRKAYFELLSEDDQTDPKTATIAASRIYNDNGIAQISPSATAVNYTTQGFKTAFRVMANDSQQGRVLGEFAVKKLHAKTIAVIDDKTAYGQGLADEFIKSVTAHGGQIVAHEYTTDNAVDFSAVLTIIKGKHPDLLFFAGMDPQGVPMVKQLKSLGLSAQFMMGDGGYTPKMPELAGAAAIGMYASLPGVPLDKMPNGRDFEKRYVARFKQQIQLYAPYCYDATNVMIAAMQKAGSADPKIYLPELAKISYEGITSKITFDESGDLKGGAITLYQVQKGKWVAIETMGAGTP
jgi:branched-chain amino acid transport system substrate-binding protein